MKVVQLSDLHLFAAADGRLKGVPTRETFGDVLAHIDAHEGVVDQFIITGDHTHDERRETYEAVRGMLGEKVGRCRIIPGNHDERGLMREVFPEAAAGREGPLMFSAALGGWRLIGLDTHLPGEVPGRMDAFQLEWLRGELSAHADEPTGLFMHHPPIPVGAAWMDRIGLLEPEAFCAEVRERGQVKFIACGHVHHDFAGELGSAKVYATPSTGTQFLPAGDVPDYDAKPPGYRVFELEGEEFRTRVVRVGEVKWVPVRD